jgi:hypothetical protein
MPPPPWRLAAESVTVSAQADGSVADAGQARIDQVVGVLPVPWTRTRTALDGPIVRPVARTSAPTAVSVPPTTLLMPRWTDPSGATRTRPRISSPAAFRRRMT